MKSQEKFSVSVGFLKVRSRIQATVLIETREKF